MYKSEISERIFEGKDYYSEFKWMTFDEAQKVKVKPKIIHKVLKDIDRFHHFEVNNDEE